MAGRFQYFKHLISRYPSLTTNFAKPTNLGICPFTRNMLHKFNAQCFSSLECVWASTIISSSSNRVLDKLFQNTNKVKLGSTCSIGFGIGVDILATSSESRRLTSALTAEPTDPTTIESGWLPKTEEIYAKFLSRVDSGELKLLCTTKEPFGRGMYYYTLSHLQKGAYFEYALFYEGATRKGLAVIQFGPQTQGPDGHVHGGATAAMFDAVTGIFLDKGLEKYSLTANMNINFKRPVPLNSAVVAETWVEKIEGRKSYIHCELKSTDGQVYIEGTALYISNPSMV